MSYSSRHNKNRQILREMKLPCHWCGKPWDNTFHADHLQPVAEGGLDRQQEMVEGRKTRRAGPPGRGPAARGGGAPSRAPRGAAR